MGGKVRIQTPRSLQEPVIATGSSSLVFADVVGLNSPPLASILPDPREVQPALRLPSTHSTITETGATLAAEAVTTTLKAGGFAPTEGRLNGNWARITGDRGLSRCLPQHSPPRLLTASQQVIHYHSVQCRDRFAPCRFTRLHSATAVRGVALNSFLRWRTSAACSVPERKAEDAELGSVRWSAVQSDSIWARHGSTERLYLLCFHTHSS